MRANTEADMHDVHGKRISVIGAGKSGRAAARMLSRKGANVFLTEQNQLDADLRQELERQGVEVEEGGHSDRGLKAEMMVVSPGVPSTIALIQEAFDRGIPVYSELEVASWFCPGTITAITGSNGKTTTTRLLAHVYATANVPYVTAGNIGTAFSDHVLEMTDEMTAILEVSSFQLDHVAQFRPDVAVLLNITPDHLDRYNNRLSDYAQSKFRLFANQNEGDALIYNRDDDLVREYVERFAQSRAMGTFPVSCEKTVKKGGYLAMEADGSQKLVIHVGEQETLLQRSDVPLRGRHNSYNVLAAAVAARIAGIRNEVLAEGLRSFRGVPHRLEFVREYRGITYINDSKATNVDAVWYALDAFDSPVILVAGGQDKGNNYAPLLDLVREKVRVVVALGESAEKVIDQLGAAASRLVTAESMEEAVSTSTALAKKGDVVLLSPACASFDMFDNYEHRGEVFKEAVFNLDN